MKELVRIVGVPAEVRTGHLPNTVKHKCLDKPSGVDIGGITDATPVLPVLYLICCPVFAAFFPTFAFIERIYPSRKK